MEDVREKLNYYFIGLILVIAVLASLGVSQNIIDIFFWVFAKLIIATITSFVVGSLVEGFTGDWLKRISWIIEIRGMKFSITFFAIIVVILQFLIFH